TSCHGRMHPLLIQISYQRKRCCTGVSISETLFLVKTVASLCHTRCSPLPAADLSVGQTPDAGHPGDSVRLLPSPDSPLETSPDAGPSPDNPGQTETADHPHTGGSDQTPGC